MKFTLDVENKTIQIHGSFTQKDLSEIFNVLNIKNINVVIIITIFIDVKYWSSNKKLYIFLNIELIS